MITGEIKMGPCPWCQSTTDLQILDGSEVNRRFDLHTPTNYAVNCPDCGCNGPMAETPEKAVAAWNRAHREGGAE